MKRTFFIGAGLAIAALAFAAGNAAPKLKFPYAGEALNAPCEKTLLEWRCATKRLKSTPIVATREWHITHLVAEPRTKGLLLRANICLRRGAKPQVAARWYGRAKEIATEQLTRRFRTLPAPSSRPVGPFVTPGAEVKWAHCRVEYYRDGKLEAAEGMTLAGLGSAAP